MRKLLIEVDCQDRHCGDCRMCLDSCCMLYAYWDDILLEWFGKELKSETVDFADDFSQHDYVRIPECLEAERKALEGKVA